MKCRRRARDRARRRRWRDRATQRLRRLHRAQLSHGARHIDPVSRVLGELEFTADPAGLSVAATEYHASPLHLEAGDLVALGLCLLDDEEDRRPRSVAKPWAAALRTRADRTGQGPALAQAGWHLPEGRRVGGFLFARVRGGIDAFVVDYHAQPARLSAEDLAALGLAWLPRANRSPRARKS